MQHRKGMAKRRLKAIKDGSVGLREQGAERVVPEAETPRREDEMNDDEWWEKIYREEEEYARLDEQRLRSSQARRAEVTDDFPKDALLREEHKRENPGGDREDVAKKLKDRLLHHGDGGCVRV